MNSKGFDISYWQGDKIDFTAAKADGYDWVICRASHGNRKDETFIPNVKKARDVGMVVGAYHYIYVDSGNSQCQKLVEQVDASDGIHTPVFLDVESASNAGATVAEWRNVINANVALLENRLFDVGFYTSYWMWRNLTSDMREITGKPTEDYTLWAAHWADVPSPLLPQPWDMWEFWQQGSDLTPPWNGAGRTDYGVYNGTPQQLREKYLGEPPQPDTHVELWAAVTDIQNKLAAIKKAL
jgi:lysozyme